MSNNRFLNWTMGIPEKLEPGMLVMMKDGTQVLVGDVDCTGESEFEIGQRLDVPDSASELIEKWAYLVRDFELQWYSDLAKGKK